MMTERTKNIIDTVKAWVSLLRSLKLLLLIAESTYAIVSGISRKNKSNLYCLDVSNVPF